MVEAVKLTVAITATICFTVDLILRWKRKIGITDIAEWKGLISFPALAVFGGITSFVCGWLGWGLMITASLAASDGVKVAGGSGAIPLERAIIIRLVLLAEVAVLAYCAVSILQRSELVVATLTTLF